MVQTVKTTLANKEKTPEQQLLVLILQTPLCPFLQEPMFLQTVVLEVPKIIILSISNSKLLETLSESNTSEV